MKLAILLSFVAGSLSFAAFLTLSEPMRACEARVNTTVWGVKPGSNPRKLPVFGWVEKSRVLVGSWAVENGRSICVINLDIRANTNKSSSPTSG